MTFKRINETFSEEEFMLLKEFKGELSWHDFIMTLTEKEECEVIN